MSKITRVKVNRYDPVEFIKDIVNLVKKGYELDESSVFFTGVNTNKYADFVLEEEVIEEDKDDGDKDGEGKDKDSSGEDNGSSDTDSDSSSDDTTDTTDGNDESTIQVTEEGTEVVVQEEKDTLSLVNETKSKKALIKILDSHPEIEVDRELAFAKLKNEVLSLLTKRE